jgi:four helix bundle protein
MQDFRNLEVWKKAHELALDVQKTLARTKRIDASTRAQMSRAANSIAANIVEGCGKSSRSELARFSDISTGSTIEVRKMLFGLRKAIRNGVTNRQPKPATAA